VKANHFMPEDSSGIQKNLFRAVLLLQFAQKMTRFTFCGQDGVVTGWLVQAVVVAIMAIPLKLL
jgi:hypothetical protein